jgi:hypothetical protein
MTTRRAVATAIWIVCIGVPLAFCLVMIWINFRWFGMLILISAVVIAWALAWAAFELETGEKA